MLLIIGILAASACIAVSDDSIDAVPGQDFQLRVGQVAHIAAEKTRIGIESVGSDSRCGNGEACVWQGDAVVRVWIHSADKARLDAELHISSSDKNAVSYGDFNLRLVSVLPPAIAGKSILQSEYLITLRFDRGNAQDLSIY